MKKTRLSIVTIAVIIVPLLLTLMSMGKLYSRLSEYLSSRDWLAGSLRDIRLVSILSSGIDECVNEQTGFKEMAGANSLITKALVGDYASRQVVAGEDGWLFYTDEKDGDPLGEYTGRLRYSEDELKQITDSAAEATELAAKKGTKLYILIAPNKEEVYCRFMPERFRKAKFSRTKELADALKLSGVNVVYPLESLTASSYDGEIYFKKDSHWNMRGAYIGPQELLKSMGVDIPDFEEMDFKKFESTAGNSDLANILGFGRFRLKGDTDYYTDALPDTIWDDNALIADNVWYYHNEDAISDKCALLIGDSFRAKMLDIMSYAYKDLYVVTRGYFDGSMLDEYGVDVMVAEYVQRYSPGIADLSKMLR